MLRPGSGSVSCQLSLSHAMQAAIHCGAISRASIARQTDLPRQTVAEVVRILCEQGWVQGTGRTSGPVGHTATTYELVADSALMIAVELGGTKLRMALVDLVGTVLAEVVEPTVSEGGEGIARQIRHFARKASATSGVDLARVRLTVVGCPGVPNAATGGVDFAPNIAGINRIDFRGLVAEATGTPVLLENDVNLAAIGEYWLGAAQGSDDVALNALGTGIGAGILVRGEFLRGARGAAGELGYLPFGADAFEEESFRIGALEPAIGTQGIRAAHRLRTGRDLDVRGIFEAATAGHGAAAEVLDATAGTLAPTVASLVAIVNPELVVLGGSIGARPKMAEATRRALVRCCPTPVRIEPNLLGNHAALSGAVAVGLTEFHTTLFAQASPGASVILPTPRSDLARSAAE